MTATQHAPQQSATTEELSSVLDQSIEATPHNLYQRIDDPLIAAEQMGKWLVQMGACKTPGEGAIFAMSAQYNNRDITDMLREYMVVQGRLTRKYQLMLVDLRKAGGDYRWTATGDDGQAATIEIDWNGKTETYTFTIEMAQKAGLVKADSGWSRIPGNMLRSKTVRNALDMYCPEVSAGYATPEDLEGVQVTQASHKNTPEQVAARREGLQVEPASPVEPEPEPVEQPSQSQPDPDVKSATETTSSDGKATAEQIRQIYELSSRLGFTKEQTEKMSRDGKHGTIPDNYTAAQAAEVIAGLGKHIEAKREQAK